MGKIKVKVEKSLYPEATKTHIVLLFTETKGGCGVRGLFKGSFKECQNYKKEFLKSRGD